MWFLIRTGIKVGINNKWIHINQQNQWASRKRNNTISWICWNESPNMKTNTLKMALIDQRQSDWNKIPVYLKHTLKETYQYIGKKLENCYVNDNSPVVDQNVSSTYGIKIPNTQPINIPFIVCRHVMCAYPTVNGCRSPRMNAKKEALVVVNIWIFSQDRSDCD